MREIPASCGKFPPAPTRDACDASTVARRLRRLRRRATRDTNADARRRATVTNGDDDADDDGDNADDNVMTDDNGCGK